MSLLDENIAKFIRSEGKFKEPSLKSYIQSLEEILNAMEARTLTEARRLEVARQQIKSIGRQTRKLEESMSLLENENKVLKEQIQILEETKKTNESNSTP